MHDAIIIGAGPAGLNAALILGRCRRRVLVFDSGKPRNAASQGLHGFLSRDGTHPMRLRAKGRDEIARYETVEFRDVPVTGAERIEGGFEVRLSDDTVERARLLLLATGRIDVMPEIEGFREFYGKGIYHCPYCDGGENRDRPIAIVGHDESAASLAQGLLVWSRELTLCTAGEKPAWSRETGAVLERAGVRVVSEHVRRVEGRDRCERLVFDDREPLAVGAVFFCSDCLQKSTLPERLGCEFDPDGNVRCKGNAATNVPGLFVAGNVRGGIHLAIMAAAEGAEAGIAMNEHLLDADVAAGRFASRG